MKIVNPGEFKEYILKIELLEHLFDISQFKKPCILSSKRNKIDDERQRKIRRRRHGHENICEISNWKMLFYKMMQRLEVAKRKKNRVSSCSFLLICNLESFQTEFWSKKNCLKNYKRFFILFGIEFLLIGGHTNYVLLSHITPSNFKD